MRRSLPALAAFAGLFLAAACLPARAESPKPVVELFTSQGCSSCPPADRILAHLAREGDVIALSQHVDYWNYIGWTDPFSDAGATERQRAYRMQLGTSYVYTPQMVFDGVTEAVGSDLGAVREHIAEARRDRKIPLSLERDGARAVVHVPAGAEMAKGATVWEVDYDAQHTTRVRRGENTGETLVNANVVRKMRRLGTYDGAAMSIPVDLARLREAGRSGCAILVQAPRAGRIFGAIAFGVAPGS